MNEPNAETPPPVPQLHVARGSAGAPWLYEIEPRPVSWSIHDIFPRRVVILIVGPRNVGKSLIAISLAAFVLIYAVIATVDLLLMLTYSRKELPPPRTETDADATVPAVQY